MEGDLQIIHLNDKVKNDFGRITCNHCQKTFSTQRNMKKHVEMIHENGKLKCDICSKLISSYYLKKHTDTFHFGINRVICNHCNKTFTTKSDMKKHVKRFHMSEKVKCEICSKLIASYYLKKHTDTCNFGINKVKKHVKRIHMIEKLECKICSHCDISFTTKHKLDTHIKTNHMNMDNKAKCDICSKLISSNHLKLHIDTVHFDLMRVNCIHCKKSFVTKSDMKKHVQRIHITGKKKCEFCSKLISRKYFKHHINQFRHDLNRINCSQCEKSFATKEYMKKHVQIVHMNKNYKIKCEKCEKFITRNNLKQHNDTVHLDLKRANCILCKKSFVTKSDMRKHVRRIHMSEKVKCDLCLKLISSSYLKHHVYTFHHGINRVNCTYCEKNFITKSEMKKHVKRKHKNTNKKDMEEGNQKEIKMEIGEIDSEIYDKLVYDHGIDQETSSKGFSFQCLICGEIFQNQVDLIKHVEDSHNTADETNVEDIDQNLRIKAGSKYVKSKMNLSIENNQLNI